MRHESNISRIARALVVASALSLPQFAVFAQSAAAHDERWRPWLGCWRPAGSMTPVRSVGETAPATAATMICVVPGSTATSVEVVNFAGGKITERTVLEPGAAIAKKVEECAGSETATWSKDGRRLMLRGTFKCPNGITRSESGVMSVDADGEWVQAQGVSLNGNASTYIAHFVDTGIALEAIADGAIVERPMMDSTGRRISPPRDGCTGSETVTPSPDGQRLSVRSDFTCATGLHRVASAEFARGRNGDWTRTDKTLVPFGSGWVRASAGAPVTTNDVLEVAKVVDANVAEAWLTDRGQTFELNGKELVRLADGGMPPRVIDMMVAMAHPETFALRRAGQATGDVAETSANRVDRGRAIMDRMCASDPVYCRSAIGLSWLYGADRYYGFDPYGYGYNYGYGLGYPYYRYGYGYGYGYPYGNYWGPGYYSGNGPVVVIQTTPSQPRGRAVFGQGYTRGGSSSSGSSSAGFSGSSGSSSSSGGSSSGSSSSGSSSSGSSAGAARTAKPRGGG